MLPIFLILFLPFPFIFFILFFTLYPLSIPFFSFSFFSSSINKKSHININVHYQTKHCILLYTYINILKKISSDHKNEIQIFWIHFTCTWILKMIRRNKWFNPLRERENNFFIIKSQKILYMSFPSVILPEISKSIIKYTF